jgi:hypothetical protein
MGIIKAVGADEELSNADAEHDQGELGDLLRPG